MTKTKPVLTEKDAKALDVAMHKFLWEAPKALMRASDFGDENNTDFVYVVRTSDAHKLWSRMYKVLKKYKPKTKAKKIRKKAKKV